MLKVTGLRERNKAMRYRLRLPVVANGQGILPGFVTF